MLRNGLEVTSRVCRPDPLVRTSQPRTATHDFVRTKGADYAIVNREVVSDQFLKDVNWI